ncbi:MAG: hypothetical protein E6K71_04740 [Candidatus Eisenbacteria bacterium]|uniref:DHHA1 domain-containing protein n=1 Tax=Eiseniibacteriota bacterium TaxID=2212470 RepID=A0A538SDJ3_UNCEI|nr:MAG: hypothetical protein E6K71_04740 [Candidatus Eisenbacteria bacterium]
MRLVRVRRDPREPERPGGDHHPALDGEVQGRNARGLRLRRPRPPSPARAREAPSRARPGVHRGRSRSAQSRRAPEGGEPAHGPEAQDAPPLISAKGGIALLVAGGDTPKAHFSAPAGTISVGDLLGRLARELGGKGGGRPESAQGAIPPQAIEALVRAAGAVALAGVEEGKTS